MRMEGQKWIILIVPDFCEIWPIKDQKHGFYLTRVLSSLELEKRLTNNLLANKWTLVVQHLAAGM